MFLELSCLYNKFNKEIYHGAANNLNFSFDLLFF